MVAPKPDAHDMGALIIRIRVWGILYPHNSVGLSISLPLFWDIDSHRVKVNYKSGVMRQETLGTHAMSSSDLSNL